MTNLDPKIRAYYERGAEADRLLGGLPSGPLELARTQELILRFLPPSPAKILDVGGGPGVYAVWLAERGYDVHVVDPIPLHIDQATRASSEISAEVGDARALSWTDDSADVLLLLGPLYHLTDRNDRLQALREANRVLREDGLLFAAAISRYAALLDLLVRLDRLHEPEVLRTVENAVASGVFRHSEQGLFTTAYFHAPSDLLQEVTEGGFRDVQIFNVEGPGFLLSDFEAKWADPERREAILRAARLVETDSEMLAASSHLLTVARATR